jgi:hypothetical protein
MWENTEYDDALSLRSAFFTFIDDVLGSMPAISGDGFSWRRASNLRVPLKAVKAFKGPLKKRSCRGPFTIAERAADETDSEF